MLSRRAAKKPLLMKWMKSQRLQFAKEHAHWTYEDWSEVLFSNESTFKTIRATGKLWGGRSGLTSLSPVSQSRRLSI
jgi:hypothetical protein